jgi:hypothetical protein
MQWNSIDHSVEASAKKRVKPALASWQERRTFSIKREDVVMNTLQIHSSDLGDKSLVILQSLLCLLREKNVLTRADIEELRDKVQTRAIDHANDPLTCCPEGAGAAATEMAEIGEYIGRRYGGKHRRA